MVPASSDARDLMRKRHLGMIRREDSPPLLTDLDCAVHRGRRPAVPWRDLAIPPHRCRTPSHRHALRRLRRRRRRRPGTGPGRSHPQRRTLQPDILAGQFERVLARDPDTERGLAQPPQAAVQRPVPRRIGHHVRPEVGAPQGGQDAGERDPARMVAGCVGHPGWGRITAILVAAKSSPMHSTGCPVRSASAYVKQSPKFSPAG